MRKLIDDERKRLREVRTLHLEGVASRTELEGFLRQCLADIKQQISMHRLQAIESVNPKPQTISMHRLQAIESVNPRP